MADEKPKIIVDEDWKSQVQSEREAAASAQYEETRDSEQPAKTAEGQPLPLPTLSSLVIALATQAMASLGIAADPDGNPLPIDRQHASYLIDTLAMLDEKTTTHRTSEETDLLSDILHQLRMAFVTLRDRPA